MSANQPIPLLHSGQAGNYFGTEYEGLPTDIHPAIKSAGSLLEDNGLKYLGKLTCSQFAYFGIYVYARGDRKVAVSLLTGSGGLLGIDCVSKFADGSFLTTTTVKVMPRAYDQQKLFRVSFPEFNALQLLEQHLDFFEEFEYAYGNAQTESSDLLTFSQMVDEYITRQQSNPGHGMLQWLGSITQRNIQQEPSPAINRDSNSDDYYEEFHFEFDFDEEYDFDRIDYNLDDSTPLIQAILQNNLEQVETLLQEGIEAERRDWDDEVPLVAAVYNGNPAIIKTLIAAGANPRELDFRHEIRPLGLAIKRNSPHLVQLLLELGASPNDGELCDSGLSLAISKNNIELTKMLLDAGACPNLDMEEGYRAIMDAARCGDLDIVKLLIEYGADINAISTQSNTAITAAAEGGNREIFEYLYPLVNEKNQRYADRYGRKELEKAIIRKKREANKLSEKLGEASVFGMFCKVQELIQAGADVNTITSKGKTPLIWATMYGHKQIMELLLDSGADPNQRSEENGSEGQTALMEIAGSYWTINRIEVINFLIDRGANINLQDIEGRTALMLGIENADSVKALIQAGANLDLRDWDGNTAFMLADSTIRCLLRQAGASEIGLNDIKLTQAVEQGNLFDVETLLDAGANPDYTDGQALTCACQKGYLAIVDRLIKAGANVNLGGRTGETAIATAAYEGHLEIVQRLLAAGADPHQPTSIRDDLSLLDYVHAAQTRAQYLEKDDRNYEAIINLLLDVQVF